MAEKVWIRDYAEKHGCEVDWNPDLGTVVLDGKYNIWPSEVSEGKAYIDKRVVDAALRYLGYEPSEEAPPTSGETREQREREEYRQERERSISRSIPSWDDAKEYLRRELYEPFRSWVIDHIWNPTIGWVQDTYNSIRSIIPSAHEIYEGVKLFLNKVKAAIGEKALQTINIISEWYGYAVSWVKFNLDKLDYLVSDEIITAIFHLRFYLKKFIWLVEDAFEQIFHIVTQTADVVASYIVRTFYEWIDYVGSLLEDYIVDHWDE